MTVQNEVTTDKRVKKKDQFITARRRQILKLLAEYRFLTTNQMHGLLQADREVKRTWEELDRLRQLGLVQGYSIEPQRGIYSELCWLLLLKGAKSIEFKEYTSYYHRKPSLERIMFRTLELELESQIREANSSSAVAWILEKPRNMKTVTEQVIQTAQYQRLVEALNWKIFVQTGRKPIAQFGFQTLCIPPQANDYVAYTEAENHLAVALILPPPKSSEKFWMSRISKYQDMAKELLVFGVFEDEQHATTYKPLLNPHGLRVTILNRVGVLLDSIGRQANQL